MTNTSHKHSNTNKPKVTFPANVALTIVRQTRGSVFEIHEHQVEQNRQRQHNRPERPHVRVWRWVKGQPEVAIGLWLGWLVGFTICLGYRVYVDMGVEGAAKFWMDHVAVLGVLAGTELICVVVWMVLITGEPGQVATADKDLPALLTQAANGYPPLDQSHCTTCVVAKPIRSKHCASCGVCVARMDHHCVWINNCVGFQNHRLFVAFLIVHLVVLGLYLALFSLYLSSKHTYLEVHLRDSLPEVTIIFWTVVSCMFVAKLLTDQLNGIARNITVNESINWKRYAYLNTTPDTSSAVAMANPFDHGWQANAREFWTRSVNYMALMHVPTPKAPDQTKIISS
ncbi:hypothetical protein H310_04581 [Aphanomyces invadans]|uniref:Palmitoyltransferase n=1 Tax=Aphanomyces invadans TaxID=157072 RepID=A0A024UF33_9STRA|nr:hypothetical protein H310_04581 [Aphanomyces invadans]ETW04253.1 hypothetical protein H310_04581 [Aphanomyces invadans]|eukprot:XP_008867209.1 hypothetical protein H310_04581 [Aphanomyces invadans]